MIISFGWTTPALVAGHKTVTRRDWNPKHAARFKAGMLVDAWNTSPRNVRGNPHKVATIRLTADPYLEWTNRAPSAEWDAEGFQYLSAHAHKINGITPRRLWGRWHTASTAEFLYVVRFEVVEVLE